jgi:hypothetical protein
MKANLVGCHIKVNLRRSPWSRAIVVNSLAGKDELGELLNPTIEVHHRLRLVSLLTRTLTCFPSRVDPHTPLAQTTFYPLRANQLPVQRDVS